MSARLETVQIALRNRALNTIVCTTDATSLAATATGFTRASGSFITDGFVRGMEIVSSGFGQARNNSVGLIDVVAAGVLTVVPFVITGDPPVLTRPPFIVEVAGNGRVIASKTPSRRAWENENFTPIATIPYLEEEFVPATKTVVTTPVERGKVAETGLYVLKWYGIAGVGATVLRRSLDKLDTLFTPGTSVITSDGLTVFVRTDVAPQTGAIIPLTGGRSVLLYTISWLVRSRNAILA